MSGTTNVWYHQCLVPLIDQARRVCMQQAHPMGTIKSLPRSTDSSSTGPRSTDSSSKGPRSTESSSTIPLMSGTTNVYTTVLI